MQHVAGMNLKAPPWACSILFTREEDVQSFGWWLLTRTPHLLLPPALPRFSGGGRADGLEQRTPSTFSMSTYGTRFVRSSRNTQCTSEVR